MFMAVSINKNIAQYMKQKFQFYCIFNHAGKITVTSYDLSVIQIGMITEVCVISRIFDSSYVLDWGRNFKLAV